MQCHIFSGIQKCMSVNRKSFLGDANHFNVIFILHFNKTTYYVVSLIFKICMVLVII